MLSATWGHNEKAAVRKPGRVPTRTWLLWHPDSTLPASRTVRSQCLLFKPPVCSILFCQLEVRQIFKQLYKYTNYTNIWIKMFTRTLFVIKKIFFNFNIYQKRNYQMNHAAFIIWDSEQLWERIGEIHMNMEIYPHDTVLNEIKQVAK